MTGQLGFAEAFLAAKAGQNERLDRISKVLDWLPFAAILKPLAPSGGPGRPRAGPVSVAPPNAGPAEPRVDPDAAFTKKEGKTVYGYKAHVAVDRGSGLIRRARLTPANVHDTKEADNLAGC